MCCLNRIILMYAHFTYKTFGSYKLQMFSGDMKLGEVDKLMLI